MYIPNLKDMLLLVMFVNLSCKYTSVSLNFGAFRIDIWFEVP